MEAWQQSCSLMPWGPMRFHKVCPISPFPSTNLIGFPILGTKGFLRKMRPLESLHTVSRTHPSLPQGQVYICPWVDWLLLAPSIPVTQGFLTCLAGNWADPEGWQNIQDLKTKKPRRENGTWLFIVILKVSFNSNYKWLLDMSNISQYQLLQKTKKGKNFLKWKKNSWPCLSHMR